MDFTINGKPLNALRVVDLKVELEKRGLPKSGNKNDLIERLSHYLVRQAQNKNDFPGDCQTVGQDVGPGAQPPNMSLSHGLTDNDFVRDYLKLRETQFASALSDQDAHLQSRKTEDPDVKEPPIPGNAKYQSSQASVIDALKNPNPVDRQEPTNKSLDIVPPQLTVSSSETVSSKKEVQYINRSTGAQDGKLIYFRHSIVAIRLYSLTNIAK